MQLIDLVPPDRQCPLRVDVDVVAVSSYAYMDDPGCCYSSFNYS